MDQSKLHETVGKLTYDKFGLIVTELEESVKDHRQTYALLRALKDGSVSMDQVTITDGGWEVTPSG